MKGFFAAVGIMACFALLAYGCSAADSAVECSAAQGGRGQYWSWREVDGRRCYYPGRPGKPKSELYWRERSPSEEAPARAGQLEPAPPAAPDPAPIPHEELVARAFSNKEALWRATAEDQEKAFTCCWPEPPTARASVESNGTPPAKIQDRVVPIEMPSATPPARPLWPFMLLMVGLVAGSILLAQRRLT